MSKEIKLSTFILLMTIFDVLTPSISAASTIPPLEFDSKRRVISAVLIDLSIDFAISDGWSAGATSMYNVWGNDLALRTTWRSSNWLGATVAIGTSFQTAPGVRVPDGVPVPAWQAFWLQPAIVYVFALPVAGATIRATLGPYIGFNVPNGTTFANIPTPIDFKLIPNLEFSLPINTSCDLTVGGNSLIGVRSSF